MTDAERWIRERLVDTPAELLEAMCDAAAVHPLPVPEALARGALDLYERLARGAGDRSDALPLLAADALLTHAFEALAEIDLPGIEAASRRWGATPLSAWVQ